MKLFLVLFGTFLLTGISIFFPFLSPLYVTIPGSLAFGENAYIVAILCGISSGLALTFVIFIIRKFKGKISNFEIGRKLTKKITEKKGLHKVNIFLEEEGYIAILPLIATCFSSVVCYVFFFTKKVNYLKFAIMACIGDSLTAILFVSGFKSIFDINSDMPSNTKVILIVFVILFAVGIGSVIHHVRKVKKGIM